MGTAAARAPFGVASVQPRRFTVNPPATTSQVEVPLSHFTLLNSVHAGVPCPKLEASCATGWTTKRLKGHIPKPWDIVTGGLIVAGIPMSHFG
jgi:hypothetical protein